MNLLKGPKLAKLVMCKYITSRLKLLNPIHFSRQVSGKTKTTLSKLSDLDFPKKSPEDEIAQRFMLLPELSKSNLSVKE